MFCCRKKKSDVYSVKENLGENKDPKPVPEAYTTTEDAKPGQRETHIPGTNTSTNEEDNYSEHNVIPRERTASQCSFYSIRSVYSVANTEGDFYSICSAESFKST
ncbi:unnamed protein product [Acanthoscelides obtectus]|uniref:Uncharacterized protein n=1 Tax=Acanthoscelides obtectus TaxID=200917 RepID=A0A9P0M3T9_ACAOB|nr:unnamed protein product [Acanthoscelides obtectus]CAK1679757.1 hypothetical protein AOBTE_LOCUS32428 [Acanthoscelides obtectus]